jgi:hypothetical protein
LCRPASSAGLELQNKALPWDCYNVPAYTRNAAFGQAHDLLEL